MLYVSTCQKFVAPNLRALAEGKDISRSPVNFDNEGGINTKTNRLQSSSIGFNQVNVRAVRVLDLA